MTPDPEVTQSSHGPRGGVDGPAGPTVRAAALIVRDGRLLLVRQDRQGESYWLLPGGGVAFGERFGEALVRELREELALEIVPGGPVALVEAISDDMERYPKHVVHVIVAAELADSGRDPRLGGDVAVLEARFVAPHELAELRLTPPIADFLEGWLSSPVSDAVSYLGVRW
jgi:8-oxo-dGTP diphosphatase